MRLTEEQEQEAIYNIGHAHALMSVAKWLDANAAYKANISGGAFIDLPFLNPANYKALYVVLKQGRLPRICSRCRAAREDDVDSDICGSCADDLRSG